jgi:hypothetical protein
MTLDPIERGILEQVIDAIAEATPNLTRTMRELSSSFMIKEESDFMVGIGVGMITAAFQNIRLTMGKESMKPEDSIEATQIIARRLGRFERLYSKLDSSRSFRRRYDCLA